MKCTIKALNPVYRTYVATIINAIQGMPGVLSASLDSEDQYNFFFAFEFREDSDTTEIMGQIKRLLRLYGSTILAITQY
jgi:hypothetical protein